MKNTGRTEDCDKTVPEPNTHSLVLFPGSCNTPSVTVDGSLVTVKFFWFGGDSEAVHPSNRLYSAMCVLLL